MVQEDSGPAMYCPIWVYIWKHAFITESFPMLKSNSSTKEIAGKTLLTPKLLAFLNCCIMMATAHFAQNVSEAEKRVSVSTHCPKMVAEHAHGDAQEAREAVMNANGLM